MARAVYRSESALPAAQLLEPRHDVTIIAVDAVDIDERLVGRFAITGREQRAAEIVEQPELLLLGKSGLLERPPVPLHRQLRQTLVEETDAEHGAALDEVAGRLGSELEFAD